MDVLERTHRVFTGQGLPDRVPVHAWLGLQFIRTLVPRRIRMADLFQMWIDDPVGTLVKYQEDLGFDPLMSTMSHHIGEHEVWARMLFPCPNTDNWHETITELDSTPLFRIVQNQIDTPSGRGQYTYRIEGYSSWLLEHLIKTEDDLEILRHRPDPELIDWRVFRSMVEKVGNRAWWLHHAPGPWDEAVELRGFMALSTDIYDRPDFVHRLMRIVTDRLKKLYTLLGKTGIQSLSMNETWVGVGISPEIYREFILPYEIDCVDAAHAAGMLVSFHNCGRGADFLEDVAASGADALETITSYRNAGDFELADVRRRVGDSICLFGGFDERLLNSDDPARVRDEVRRCIDAAAAGGRYILRPSGQIFHADLHNISAMIETAHEYGRYS